MGHDASAFVGQLKDHLAAHDRPISFLFGAGTSCCVSKNPSSGPFAALIPAIVGLTDACKGAVERLGIPQANAWIRLASECDDLRIPANIESILGRIRSKLDAVTGTDEVSGFDRGGWEAIDAAVRREIASLVAPLPTSIPQIVPHNNFARWARNTSRRHPIEVFTTNYDVLFERSFDALRVPHFDGFIGSQHPYFSSETIEDESLLPPASWIRFWKLHGSVSWSVDTVAGESRITRGAPSSSGEMILPSHRKYDESRKEPYRSLMDRLSVVLARKGALLLTCGYSFGDQHINSIIFDSLDQNPNTHLMALFYGDIDTAIPLARRASETANIIVAGRNAAVISTRFASWTVTGKADAQLSAATFGLVQADPSDPAVPRMHAGDFQYFSSFLNQIQGGR